MVVGVNEVSRPVTNMCLQVPWFLGAIDEPVKTVVFDYLFISMGNLAETVLPSLCPPCETVAASLWGSATLSVHLLWQRHRRRLTQMPPHPVLCTKRPYLSGRFDDEKMMTPLLGTHE